jgi:hypothetical protein
MTGSRPERKRRDRPAVNGREKIPHEKSIANGNRLDALVPGTVRLLTLNHLDRRTESYRKIMRLVRGITTDLGGDLTNVAHQLVVRASVLVAMCEHAEALWATGHEINIEEYLSVANTARRFLQTIGTKRLPKDLGNLEEHLEGLAGKSPVKYQQWAERNSETVIDAVMEEVEDEEERAE